jgi:hypothetical protein
VCPDGTSLTIPDQGGTSCSVTDNGNGTSTITCDDGTTVTVTDGQSGSCSVTDNGNGTSTITCDDGTTVTVTDGHSSSCSVTDNGNGTSTITCDDGTTATVTDGHSSSCSVTDNGNGTSTITCDDGTTVTVTDGQSGSCSVTDNGNGTHTISCDDGSSATISSAGCVATSNGDGSSTLVCPDGTSFTVWDDSEPPQTVIVSAPTDPSNDPSPLFEFATERGNRADVFHCSLDGAAYSPCKAHQVFEDLSEGSHTLSVYAERAGLSDSTPATKTWTVDLTPLDTSIDSGPAPLINTKSATLTFSASGGSDVDHFLCQCTGGYCYSSGYPSDFACSSPLVLSGLDDGEYVISVSAVDKAGNIDPTPASHTFEVDTTAPTTYVQGEWQLGVNENLKVHFSAYGATKFECRLDSSDPADWADCTSPQNLSGFALGDHAFEVRAWDEAGNVEDPPAVHDFTAYTRLPDKISANLTLSAGGSPYLAGWTTSVASGVTLTVDAGVRLEGFEYGVDLYISGAVDINGESANPVKLRFLRLNSAGETVDVQHAVLKWCSLRLTGGSMNFSSSEFWGSWSELTVKGGTATFSNNLFVSSQGFLIEGGTATFLYNGFYDVKKSYGYYADGTAAIWVTPQLGTPANVTAKHNSFMDTDRPALRVGVYGSFADATQNYFNSTNEAAIAATQIYDKTDDSELPEIVFTPILMVPDSSTPKYTP